MHFFHKPNYPLHFFGSFFTGSLYLGNTNFRSINSNLFNCIEFVPSDHGRNLARGRRSIYRHKASKHLRLRLYIHTTMKIVPRTSRWKKECSECGIVERMYSNNCLCNKAKKLCLGCAINENI